MRNFFLAVYTIRVEEKIQDNDQKEYKPFKVLSSFNGNQDLFQYLQEFFHRLKESPNENRYHKSMMRVTHLEINESSRTLTGIIESGLYGSSSRIVKKTSFETIHKKTPDQVDLLPFFFLIHIPKNRNEGIIVLEKIGEKGLRAALERAISQDFEHLFHDLHMSFGHLVVNQVIQNYLEKGIIKSLRFIKYEIPHDKVDALDEGHEEIRLHRELVYKVSDKKAGVPVKNRLKSLFKKEQKGLTVENLFEIKELDDGYDNIKVEVKLVLDGLSKPTI